ncbi:MAG: protein kinase [Candidatus Acidiferrales bacterium]
MRLASGSRVGHYEIDAPIGVGGMGEVYRANDSKLGRRVALKVLPEAFAGDAERLARFQREAKVLASLNHPNIAAIYGIEDSGTTHALVMELVEGPTLADRIQQGPIPMGEALAIAKQICDALEYAHERGVVHRDLKPANVKVTSDDAVKVLDFGLAKALEGDASSIDIMNSPTITRMATQAGVLLGTAAYMSPEQAKGRPVDRRADIWAFGCVLYEMLTGKMVFSGETVTDTLAAVIRAEPNWSQLPAAAPLRVRVLLQRCLQKDPKQRLRDIGDARISIDEVLSGAVDPAAAPAIAATMAVPLWHRAVPWLIAGILTIALAVLAWVHIKGLSAPSSGQLLRYQIFPPDKGTFGTSGADIAFSPDGRHIAFSTTGQDGVPRISVRDLDRLEARALPGTEDGIYPFWSPDSRYLAFRTANRLEKIDIAEGSPQTICETAATEGGSWNQDGTILFGSYGGVMKVPAAGGTPEMVIKTDEAHGQLAAYDPTFLPDGRHFLYDRDFGTSEGEYVGSLDGEADAATAKPLVDAEAFYAPPSGRGPGHLLFVRGGTLMAQAFDASRLELQGEPAALADHVSEFAVSADGLLAYWGGESALVQLTWFDRQGKALGTLGNPGVRAWPVISPDGNSVAVSERNTQGVRGTDIWIYNVASGARSRLTFDNKNNLYPVWSPDGSRIAFLSARSGGVNVYERAVSGIGEDEPLDTTPANVRLPLDWSRDGRYLVEGVLANAQFSISVLPVSGDRKPVTYLQGNFDGMSARLSPNGQWVAYVSDETGRDEVYVQTFPQAGGKWSVSANGGTRPAWSRDGKEIYFITLDGKLMAADVKSGAGGSFEASTPKFLFEPHIAGGHFSRFDVSKDGRFLIPTVPTESGAPITVVVNWPAALRK